MTPWRKAPARRMPLRVPVEREGLSSWVDASMARISSFDLGQTTSRHLAAPADVSICLASRHATCFGTGSAIEYNGAGHGKALEQPAYPGTRAQRRKAAAAFAIHPGRHESESVRADGALRAGVHALADAVFPAGAFAQARCDRARQLGAGARRSPRREQGQPGSRG